MDYKPLAPTDDKIPTSGDSTPVQGAPVVADSMDDMKSRMSDQQPSPSPLDEVHVPAPVTAAASAPPSSPLPDATDPQDTEGPETAAPNPANAIKKKSSKMPVVIAIVVIVVLALGVAAYFAFVKKDTVTPTTSTTSTTTTTTTTTAVEDPDIESSNIDNSLSKIDDTKDYSSTDLSDTTLGL